jgi:hypothetical protein
MVISLQLASNVVDLTAWLHASTEGRLAHVLLRVAI